MLNYLAKRGYYKSDARKMVRMLCLGSPPVWWKRRGFKTLSHNQSSWARSGSGVVDLALRSTPPVYVLGRQIQKPSLGGTLN